MKKIFLSTIILFNTILFAGFKTIIVSTTPKLQTKTFVDELSSENPVLKITTTTAISYKLAVGATYYPTDYIHGLYISGGMLYYKNETTGAGKVLMCAGDTGKAVWTALPDIAGDNLGNHIATTTLNMNYYNIENIMNLVGAGGSVIKMSNDIDIIPAAGYKTKIGGDLRGYGVDVGTINVRDSITVANNITAGKKITANDIETNFGIKSSTAYIAGMTFNGNVIGKIMHLRGLIDNTVIKMIDDIDIIPSTGYKTNIWGDLDKKTGNISNVGNLQVIGIIDNSSGTINGNVINSNVINANYILANSSITTNEICTISVHSGNYPILGLRGQSSLKIGTNQNLCIYIADNDDLDIGAPYGYTLNFFVPTSSTAGSLAGYMTIKVNNTTYKVPLYNP